MTGVARAADIWLGECCCHSDPTCVEMTGPIITFSSDVIVNSRGIARLGDITIGGCGHTGVIVSCSPDVIANGRGVARLGDSVIGCNIGVIVTCSPNVVAN